MKEAMKNKTMIPRLLMKALPMLTPVLLILSESLRLKGLLSPADAGACSLSGSALLLMYPLDHEGIRPSLVFCPVSSALQLLTYYIAAFLGIDGCLAALSVSILLLAAYLTYRSIRRFSNVRALFYSESVKAGVWEFSRHSYALSFSILAAFLLLADRCSCITLSVLVLALSLLLLAILWLRIRTGRTFFIGLSKEKKLLEIVRGSLRTMPSDVNSNEEIRMNTIYRKVMEVMEEKQVYLDADFSIMDMSTQVGSNKVYVSHVINVCSGRNFRQFLNYYRVKYSIELMKSNPELKIMDIALMSGFHSVVSYNMAFKSNIFCTPSEYRREKLKEQPDENQRAAL